MAAPGAVSMDTFLQSLEDYQRQGDPLNRVEELVEVPNTEFVALIVGRNGHKIKAIREKTETFIKTPMRNESPVFKIAGTLHNVTRAKNEITDIVQRLKSPHYRMGALGDDSQGPRITSSVRVPFKFVGLVVGFQGSTIMEIQCKTKTHIQTPAHGGDPIFQITGEPKNVWIAKIMIQFYIEYRTGLRVLDVDTLVDGSIEQPILQLLSKHGVSHTLTLLMSRLDDMLVNDVAAAHLFSTDAFATTQFLDPIDAIAIKLDSFNLEDHNTQQVFIGQTSPPPAMPMPSPPAAPQQFHGDFPNFVLNPSQVNPIQLLATPLMTERLFDATTTPDNHPLDINFQAITHQPINALFPDTAIENCNAGNFWLGPMIQPPAQQHQNHHPQMEENEPSSFLDKTFWDYVANAENELPPEQVL